MINTNGDFVSEVRNHLKDLNKDDYISARYILSVVETYIQYLINTRPLSSVMRDRNIFTLADCIEMKRVKSHKCPIAEFKTADKIVRSKKKLPKIYKSSGGLIIESVLNMTESHEYQVLRSPKDFLNTKKRQFGSSFKYYYVANDYLWVVNSTPELVGIIAYFSSEFEAKSLSSCEECDTCLSRLDDKFVCPEEFKSTVRDQTVQLLLGGNKQITEDENPDMDNNQKGRTV